MESTLENWMSHSTSRGGHEELLPNVCRCFNPLRVRETKATKGEERRRRTRRVEEREG